MKALISVQHPAHVHFFRHPIDELVAEGAEVHVVARDKDHVSSLLAAYEIPHTVLAMGATRPMGAPVRQLTYEYRLIRRARRVDPDVLAAIAEPGIAHAGTLLREPSVLFIDTAHTRLARSLAAPFADRICTPAAFTVDLGPKQLRYDGYHELAYLHPDRFTPDPSRLRRHGIDPEERYFLVRAIAWNAFHDRGKSGFSPAGLRSIVSRLEEHGTVYLSSEGELPAALATHQPDLPPALIHDLLAFADGYIGDSGTMATEAAVLGVPAVRLDPLASGEDEGNFVELESEYGLLYSTADEAHARERMLALASDPDAKRRRGPRRERLLREKIDVTAFVVDQLRSLAAPSSPEGRRRVQAN